MTYTITYILGAVVVNPYGDIPAPEGDHYEMVGASAEIVAALLASEQLLSATRE